MEFLDVLGGILVPLILVILVILILAANIKVVQQSRAYVVERLGAFQAVWGVGIHFKIPFIEKVAKVVSLKEQVVDFAPQPVICLLYTSGWRWWCRRRPHRWSWWRPP